VWGGADERSHRNVPVSPASHVPLYPVFPDPFGEGVLEGRRERRGGEAPKVRHEATHGPVAGELDTDGQGVARLGAFDVARPRLAAPHLRDGFVVRALLTDLPDLLPLRPLLLKARLVC
jgi:hypothetical protein